MKMPCPQESLKAVVRGGLPSFTSLVAFFALLFMAFASLASANPPIRAIDSSNASYQIQDGVATIFGSAEDTIEKQLIERIVLNLGNVEEVQNDLEVVKPKQEIDDNIGASAND